MAGKTKRLYQPNWAEKGVSDSLTFSSKETLNLLNNQSGLFVMHNHPRNGSFSKTDIIFFGDMDNVKSFTVIKNNGGMEVLTKADNYDKIQLTLEYKRLKKKMIKTGTDTEYDKLIKVLLSKSKSGIEWRRYDV